MAKPNILFILSDDVGLGDIGCCGGDKYKTPQIDALARDVQAALEALKGVLPGDLQIERTHNEPAEVVDKIRQFRRAPTSHR